MTKTDYEEFMATHPEGEWPKFLVAAKREADRLGMKVKDLLDRDRNAVRARMDDNK